MISIKPATLANAEPDPASGNHDTTQVIFVQDQPTKDEPEQSHYKIAARTQGGTVSLETSSTEQKEASFDVPEPSLSDDYKKSMHNTTNIQDQEADGDVNIAPDAAIDTTKQELQQVLERADQNITSKQASEHLIIADDQLKKFMHTQEKRINSIESLQALIQQKAIEPLQSEAQKVISKKHRPADLGPENSSKVQLSVQKQDNNPKKKMSLQDLQQGFSQFIKNNHAQPIAKPTSSTLGNSLYFSATGNAQQDDAQGLKFASYMNQAGKMYQSSGMEFVEAITKIIQKEGLPTANNQILITIERSGKVSSCIITSSCGNPVIDNYHIKMIESIGSFPPIPKYINAPLQVSAQFPFQSMRLMPGWSRR